MLQSFLFGLGQPSVTLSVSIADVDGRRTKVVESSPGVAETLPVFRHDEAVRGSVVVQVQSGKRLEHQGLKIELKGVIGACGFACFDFL